MLPAMEDRFACMLYSNRGMNSGKSVMVTLALFQKVITTLEFYNKLLKGGNICLRTNDYI